MVGTWATSGPDLHLEIDVSGTRVRRHLEEALRGAIQAGRLPPGARLPSSRSLAADLGIARNTVADAYGLLAAEGWLIAERGSGTRVAERVIAEQASAAPDTDQAGQPRYSLLAGSPDVSTFPRSAWLAAARRALAVAPAEALGYTDPRGRPELRTALADYLARARGVRAAADRIVICSGFTQALALLAQVLADRGATTLAVEAYGHAHHRQVIAAHGLAVHPVDVDARGAVIADLAGAARADPKRRGPKPAGTDLGRTGLGGAGLGATDLGSAGPGGAGPGGGTGPGGTDLGGAGPGGTGPGGAGLGGTGLGGTGRVQSARAGAVLLTPAHQFPLGVPLAAARRTQVVQWAAATGATIIEDDYDGEFRYDRQAIGAMQALEPGSVVYAGTASKTLAPGLRLAWLVLPASLATAVTDAKVLADRQTSSLDQLTFAEFVSSGGYDRHVRRGRMIYRRRRERLAAQLRLHAPHVRMTGVAAGLHTVLELPPGSQEDEVIARAAARGLALSGLTQYAAPGARHAPALVVGFGTPPAHAFTTAVARLCAVLAELGR
jgi:GntR family transcriptional regulator / MocR family aminotransferase